MEEIWKYIEGYDNKYSISNYGNVRNNFTNKIIIGDINNAGYRRICLYKPKEPNKKYFIHRLVAYYFCKGYNKNLIVNHIDGNKQNNRSDNLEWVTRSQNDKHAFANNLRKVQGSALKQLEKAKRKVLIKSKETNETIFIFDNYLECAKYFKLNSEYIKQCCRGMYYLKGKYIASYYEN